MAVVLPEKSDAATTSGLHSGWASTTTSGNCLRTFAMSSTVNFSWTSQRPPQPITAFSTRRPHRRPRPSAARRRSRVPAAR